MSAQLKQDRDAMLKEKDEQKAFNRDILAKFEQLQQKITPGPHRRARTGGAASAVLPSTSPAESAAAPARRGTGCADPQAIRRDCRPACARRRAWGSRACRCATRAPRPRRPMRRRVRRTVRRARRERSQRGELPRRSTTTCRSPSPAPCCWAAWTRPPAARRRPIRIRCCCASTTTRSCPIAFAAEVRECFVIGAGYGDISSERAYIRTERLSCVRHDGTRARGQDQGLDLRRDGQGRRAGAGSSPSRARCSPTR